MNIQKELEKDGVSGALYHLLWIKNEAFSEKLALNIPDTVIYFNGKPLFWYYSSTDGIRKKRKENVTNNMIFEYFQSIDSKIGVSAVFVYNETVNGEKRITCRYLDLIQLKEFLDDENKPEEGILQRFVLPFGLNNCMIQVVWGNKVCVFSKRINKRNIYDKKLDIYERCCTFDGLDHDSENVPVKGHLSQFLKTEIQKIVNHIASISYEKFLISRMLLFIKEDVKGKIWILWCNSIRIEPFGAPSNVETFFSTDTLHPRNLQKHVHCLRCNERQNSNNFLFVPYKLLIKEHDHKIRKEEEFFTLMKTYALNPIEVRNANEEENEILKNLRKANLFFIKSDNDKIPVLLRRLHPRLNNIEYLHLKSLMEFQQHKILICHDCYMELIQYLKFAGGEEFLLDSVRFRAKKESHGSTDMTIKRLEKLKRPYYDQNRELKNRVKGFCSYHGQRNCGGGGESEIFERSDFSQLSRDQKSLEKSSRMQQTASFKEIFNKEDQEISTLVSKYAGEEKKEVTGLESDRTTDKSHRNIDKTAESAFKRLERKILPKVIHRNKHGFHAIKSSLDSTNTHMTSLYENH